MIDKNPIIKVFSYNKKQRRFMSIIPGKNQEEGKYQILQKKNYLQAPRHTDK